MPRARPCRMCGSAVVPDRAQARICSDACRAESNRRSQVAGQAGYKARHADRILLRKRAAYAVGRSEFLAFKLSLGGCTKCGYNDHAVALDFHHVKPEEKVRPVTVRLWRANRAAALAESAKCVLLCANCHRVEHWV